MADSGNRNQMRKLSFLGFGTENNADPDEVKLDTEMEKVFASSQRDKDRFNLSMLHETGANKNGPPKYTDSENSAAHRSKLYGIRKPIASSLKRPSMDSSKKNSIDSTANMDMDSQTIPLTSPLAASAHIRGSDATDDEPMISERAGYAEHHSDSSGAEGKRVQFDQPKVGSMGQGKDRSGEYSDGPTSQQQQHQQQEEDSYDDDTEELRKRKTRHQHYKHRKHSHQDTANNRRQNNNSDSTSGNYLTVNPIGDGSAGGAGGAGNGARRVSMQPEDAVLEQVDIDELASHRSDDPRAMRRHKITDRRNNKDTRDGQAQSSANGGGPTKKTYDRSPHEVFVQLDELHGTGEDREWKETARWIKYEEDVEEASDRWGRPHVAPLSFHSLLNLRRCLETGVILMDLEEKDLPAVAYRIVEQMVIEELIEEDDKSVVMRSLLLRHRHVNEGSTGAFGFGSRRKFSSYTSLQSLWTDGDDPLRRGVRNSFSNCQRQQHRNTLTPPQLEPFIEKNFRRHSTISHRLNLSTDSKPKILPISEINGRNGQSYDMKIDMKEETYTISQEDLRKSQHDTILKRIPIGAEATTVLVGAVDFLQQPTIAFVRLAEGIQIPGVTEVPIPVRFIFVLLGPKNVDLDYHEVGRSIATLMSNEIFNRCAYKADDRRDLLSAINTFLDDSIVLPPGNWQRDDLLPFEELKAKSEWIRTRKEKALKEKQRDKLQIIVDEEKQLLAEKELQQQGDAGGRKPTGPLEKTGRLWGGLINDVKRRYPMYKSDITDAFNSETLAATIFMYFAAMSTAITFGGIASEKTSNLIGISETLVSCSVVGVIFHTFSGQPLVIIGTTGPLLLFDEALYHICLQNNWNFLTVRIYVGCWMAVISLVVSAFEGSVYVRLFTRFTQEIFSALITLIYIVETAMNILSVFRRHPLLESYLHTSEVSVLAPYAEALISANTSGLYDADGVAINETTFPMNLTEAFLNDTETSFGLQTSLLATKDTKGMLNQPNTALFCFMLTICTFTVAYYLRIFRNSHFLGRSARRAIGDFGVPIAIAIFVTLDFFVPQVYTDKLSVPEGLSPSDPTRRGWLIPLDGIPNWLPFASVVPALLVYILVFMETHISELIVDKPERGLKKGSGIHLDIVILCILNSVCGFFGLPWHCAATVRSVTHVSAVTIMSSTHAPGDKPHIADVKEQRVSGFIIALLVGLSVTMAPLLRLIPMSVLFGVFLYMGIASMSGVQLFDRLRLFFMPVKYHPTEPYVKKVPSWKMHTFTFVQVMALAILWTVKSSRFSLAFPFVLALTVPLRQKMSSFFTARELNALDGQQANVDPHNEPDFYEQTSIPA